MCTYETGYGDRTYQLQAASLYAAKQAAIQHFKPRRSQEHMVWVVLIGRADGSEVIHATAESG